MTANSVYSANGRIEKIFIFDTKEFRLHAEDEHPFRPVLRRYRQMAQDLNKLHPKEPVILHIFFRIARKGARPEAWLDDVHCIYFIPVNLHEPISIPTQWIQDVISIPREGVLTFATGLNPRLRHLVAQYAGARETYELDRSCPEGNLVRGKHGTYDYIIKATYKPGTCTECNLYNMTGVNPYRTFSIKDSENTALNDRVLFHSDLYCTIGGSLGSSKELVLLSQPFQESWPHFTETVSYVKGRLDAISGKYGAPEFVIGYLPMIMITDAKNKVTHALSSNNCLVENYVDEHEIRHVYFYFPDFREFAESDTFSVAAKDKLMEVAMPNTPGLAKAFTAFAAPGLESFNGQEMPDPPSITVIHTVELEIRAELHRLLDDIPDLVWNVSFVRFNFLSSSRSRGALHCMSKVVQRTRVD